jgi:hypothetical protein
MEYDNGDILRWILAELDIVKYTYTHADRLDSFFSSFSEIGEKKIFHLCIIWYMNMNMNDARHSHTVSRLFNRNACFLFNSFRIRLYICIFFLDNSRVHHGLYSNSIEFEFIYWCSAFGVVNLLRYDKNCQNY